MVRTPATPVEDAFLRAIIEEPDDDVPRLVFADFLEERGNPRGTFIRAQCQRARLAPHDPQWKDLLAQEAALMNVEWSKPFARMVDELEYRRGFVEHVAMAGADFVKHADRLFRQTPVRSLRLSRLDSRLLQIASSPHLAKVRSLDLNHNSDAVGSRALRQLGQSPFVAALESLHLWGCQMGPAGAEALASGRHWTRLASVDLTGNAIGEPGAACLSASASLAGLREVNLANNALQTTGAAALAAAANFRPTHLNLATNSIGNDGVIAIANSPSMTCLRWLILQSNTISNRAVEAIANSPYLSQLEHLNLESNRINDRGIQALAEATTLPALVYLNVANNEFGPVAAKALASSPHFPNMRQLVLGQHSGVSKRKE